MFALSLVAAVVVAPLVFAQDATLGLKAIKAHFQQSALVPDLFPSFEPIALVTLNFAGVGALQPGQKLTKEQVAPVPVVTVSPGNSSTTFSGNYTLVMLDAGTVGQSLPQTRHWLVNRVRISGSSVTIDSAVEVTAYAGPAPPVNSGPHRYVIALYSQPDSFRPPDDLSSPGVAVSTFVWADYVNSTGLGLVGATYITVEEGSSPTSSISATSPVVTSTLLGAVSSSSGSKTSTGPAPANTNGAIKATGGHVVALTFLCSLLCIII